MIEILKIHLYVYFKSCYKIFITINSNYFEIFFKLLKSLLFIFENHKTFFNTEIKIHLMTCL